MTGDQITTIHRLLTLDPGWASNAEICCTLEPEDYTARSALRKCLGELARARVVEPLYVRHRNQPMLCVKLDHLVLTAALAKADES